MPVRCQVSPPVLVSASAAPPPNVVRFTLTDVILPLPSVTVHSRVDAVVPSAGTEPGVNEQVAMSGAGSVTVMLRDIVPVAPMASVAVIRVEYVPAAMLVGTVIPVSCQVFPAVFVRATAAPPPMFVRLTKTVDRLLSASVTVHWRVAVAVPFAGREAGAYAQPETTGGELGDVVFRVALIVAVRLAKSTAKIGSVCAPGVVPTAAVTLAPNRPSPDAPSPCVPSSNIVVVVLPPIAERSIMTFLISSSPLGSLTVTVIVDCVVPLEGIETGLTLTPASEGGKLVSKT